MNAFFSFLSGAALMGAWVAGLFFLKFWQRTKDRLFLYFGIAFWIMAFERLVLIGLDNPQFEGRALIYLIRLFAFLLIIFAIIQKNGPPRTHRTEHAKTTR